MNAKRAQYTLLLLLILISAIVLLSNQVSVSKQILSVSAFATQIPASATLPAPNPGSPTPYTYNTPTPLFDLPAPDFVEASAKIAGTATRATQLTAVPTWPPNVQRPHPTLAPSTPYLPIATSVAGQGVIINSGFGDLPGGLGIFTDEWQMELGSQIIRVYAGSEAEPSRMDQGLLVVQVENRDNNSRSTPELYRTSGRDGAVEIVGATGVVLSLRSDNGTVSYFDVANRLWIPTIPVP